MGRHSDAFRVPGHSTVTGNFAVDGDLFAEDDAAVAGDLTVAGTAAVTGAVTAASFNGVLAGATAPVEVAESGATAADLWTALNALGLIVEPA